MIIARLELEGVDVSDDAIAEAFAHMTFDKEAELLEKMASAFAQVSGGSYDYQLSSLARSLGSDAAEMVKKLNDALTGGAR